MATHGLLARFARVLVSNRKPSRKAPWRRVIAPIAEPLLGWGSPHEPRLECTHPRGFRPVCKSHVTVEPWGLHCPHCDEPRRRDDDTQPA